MTKRFLFIFLLILITVALGFARDYVFVSINHSIESGNDTNGHLLILKWALTFFCSILYMAITCVFLFLIFQLPKYVWIAIVVYCSIFIAAILIGAVGHFTISFGRVYPFIRTILGILQSPIVLMILVSASFLDQKKILNKNWKEPVNSA